MTTVCELNKCTGCMACVDICPKNAINIKDSLDAYNAVIDADKCINCNLCHKICQNNNNLELSKPIKWYQGWAEDEDVRSRSSSGGAATALMLSFVENGSFVCSCIFRDGQFLFDVTNKKEDIGMFAGSKYVKSNPQGIYKKIKNLLNNGEKVLFIGLPCQVAALKLFVGEQLVDNLYTVDLICHGTPSPQLLQMFLKQYGYELKDIKNIAFRKKNKFQVRDGDKGIITNGVTDSYLISFLNGVCYTENCYSCKYAQFNRVSDITLGDSWGSDLSNEEQSKGISLILCKTDKGMHLVEHTRLKLFKVNIVNAIKNNRQLEHPSFLSEGREIFFKGILSGIRYNKIVCNIFPLQFFKHRLKRLLFIFRKGFM